MKELRQDRECSICPQWVIRCVHVGEDILMLHPALHTVTLNRPAKTIVGWLGPNGMEFDTYDSEELAFVAFEQAERELIGGTA